MLALLPAILALAPSLAEWLGGPKASAVAAQAVSVVQAVTGSTDPDVILNLPPEKRAELQMRLAEIAADQRKAELEDVANARALSAQSHLVAWAQVTGFGFVGAVWAFMILRMAAYGLPTGSGETYATVLAGVSGILGSILQFFYGSSTASAAANRRLDLLASQATTAAAPSAIATTAPVTVNQPSAAGTTADDLNTASLARARAG